MPISPLQFMILSLNLVALVANLATLSTYSLPYIFTWPGTQQMWSWIFQENKSSASCWILYEISWPELLQFLRILLIMAWLSVKIHIFLIVELMFFFICCRDFNIAKYSISKTSSFEFRCHEYDYCFLWE